MRSREGGRGVHGGGGVPPLLLQCTAVLIHPCWVHTHNPTHRCCTGQAGVGVAIFGDERVFWDKRYLRSICSAFLSMPQPHLWGGSVTIQLHQLQRTVCSGSVETKVQQAHRQETGPLQRPWRPPTHVTKWARKSTGCNTEGPHTRRTGTTLKPSGLFLLAKCPGNQRHHTQQRPDLSDLLSHWPLMTPQPGMY